MSHFTKIQTRLTDHEFLKQALENLGYEVELDAEVRGYGGVKRSAELKIATASRGYDIGFIKGAEGYVLLADWWGIKGIDQSKFVAQLTQQYARCVAKEKLRQQGFTLASEETDANGRIHLLLRRMN
jgi:hypothetical protein